jgi:DNA mismatch endonuclease (patch repair protein)
MAENLTPQQRHKNMSRIRSKDSKAELTVRRMLHARGLRFRKHVKELPGNPDLVFSRARVVVFVDGDFFHGWNFEEWKEKLSPYWRQKIEGNMARDVVRTAQLEAGGWCVLRVWEHEVKKDTTVCIDRIETIVRKRWSSPDSRLNNDQA